MKHHITLKAFLLLLALSSCSSTKDAQKKSSDITISTYKGGKITLREAEIELTKLVAKNKDLQAVQFSDLNEEQKKIIIQEAVMNEISYQEAKKRKLHKGEEYQEALKIFNEEFLKQRLYIDLKEKAGLEESVKKHYDTLVEKLAGQKEINIRYIIVKTQAEAKALATKLSKSPKYFAYQARKKSLDKETGKKGGDLGFVLKSQLPAHIVSVAESLKKGQVAKNPVQLKDQWVVVGFEGERDAEISEFKDVQQSLAESLGQKAVKDFLINNLKEANITYIQ
jgi:peptidyl-prolyl cis-trans isomerase C